MQKKEAKSQTDKLSQEVEGIQEMLKIHETNKTFYKFLLFGLFCTSLIIFMLIFFFSPSISAEEKAIVYRFPRSPTDLSNTLKVVSKYKDQHYYSTLSIWVYLYILYNININSAYNPLLYQVLFSSVF